MADPQDPYARARPILEHLRAFAWPALLTASLPGRRRFFVRLTKRLIQ